MNLDLLIGGCEIRLIDSFIAFEMLTVIKYF
jgi:hypothetical protein